MIALSSGSLAPGHPSPIDLAEDGISNIAPQRLRGTPDRRSGQTEEGFQSGSLVVHLVDFEDR